MSPTFMPATPRSQPLITSPTPAAAPTAAGPRASDGQAQRHGGHRRHDREQAHGERRQACAVLPYAEQQVIQRRMYVLRCDAQDVDEAECGVGDRPAFVPAQRYAGKIPDAQGEAGQCDQQSQCVCGCTCELGCRMRLRHDLRLSGCIRSLGRISTADLSHAKVRRTRRKKLVMDFPCLRLRKFLRRRNSDLL